MRTLLRLDASAQTTQSHSRGLADYYQAQWLTKHPNGKIIARDLVRDPVPHLDEATITVFYAGGTVCENESPPSGIILSDQLIDELKQADDILVSSSVYNFGIPSALKAWVDHIVRFGHTIAAGEHGPVGLLENKHVYLLTARGGTPERSPDYQSPLLHAVFSYIGIQKIDWISLEGTRIPDGQLHERLHKIHAAIDDLFMTKDVS